jgi:hypothetical protein
MTMALRRRPASRLRAARLNGGAVGDSARLQILLEDYAQARDDERNWNTVLASLIAVAFTLVGLLAAAVTQTCRFDASKSCTNVPDYLVGAAPLLPVALLAYTQLIGIVATYRNFYLRVIEKEIRQYAGEPLKAISPITPASYEEMLVEITSLRRGRLSYRTTTYLLVTLVIVVFGGFTAYIGWHMDPITQAVMTVIYIPVVLLLATENYLAGPGGRSMFYKTAQRYVAHRFMTGYALPDSAIEPSDVSHNDRSLLSYLILPRIAEWVKWMITPGAFVVTAWATNGFRNWHRFILVWLILEYLIYEARYQWNDIRGLHEDADHPETGARLRLPGAPNARRNIVLSCLAGILRLTLAEYIAARTHLLPVVTLLIVLVFGVAIGYEALRAVPASTHLSFRLTPRIIAIWVIVGFGYAIRAGTGMWLGGLRLLSFTAISAMLYFVALGIMFVLLMWVTEAASYCSTDGKDIFFPTPGLAAKPHVAALLAFSGWNVAEGKRALPGAAVPVLKEKQGKLYAPWNAALFLGAGLGAVAGVGLTRSSLSLSTYGPVVAASLIGALLLMIFKSFAARLAVTAAIAAILLGITWPETHNTRAVIAAIPWIAIAFNYTFFRESSYQDLMNFGPNLISGLRSAALKPPLLALRLIVGHETWRSAGFGRQKIT